jgi:predicted TIM-barrel fold metal-dependent hydrolase
MHCLDCHNHIGVEMGAYLSGSHPYAQMLPQMIGEGSAHGTTHWVVFPMVTNLACSLKELRAGRVVIASDSLEQIPYAWENRRMLEEVYLNFPKHAPNVYPFVMADPSRVTDLQARALVRLREENPGHRFYGLKFQTTMLQSPIKALLDAGRVFLDLAAEWDLPLLIHSSVYAKDPWAQASDILDIVEAHPKVRFCLAHSCRFDREYLQRVAALPNCWFDCSAHGIHCQLAVDAMPQVAAPERRFDTDYSRPEIVLRDLAQAFPNKMMWGSDSPYYSFVDARAGIALRSSYGAEAGYLHFLPAILQRHVAWENARRCFRLPLPDSGDQS